VADLVSHGAIQVRLIGSVARGDARPDSGVDLLLDQAAFMQGLGEAQRAHPCPSVAIFLMRTPAQQAASRSATSARALNAAVFARRVGVPRPVALLRSRTPPDQSRPSTDDGVLY
jgi:hypothetical protein